MDHEGGCLWCQGAVPVCLCSKSRAERRGQQYQVKMNDTYTLSIMTAIGVATRLPLPTSIPQVSEIG